jgi:molybdopterin converting factor small subunit
VGISVRLYGEFREMAPRYDEESGTIGKVKLDQANVDTTGDLIKEFELREDEVSHVFVNGTYSSLKKELEEGDEVALFPVEMGLLYHWYFEEED